MVNTLTEDVHKKLSSIATIRYAVGKECLEQLRPRRTWKEESPVHPIDASKRYRD